MKKLLWLVPMLALMMGCTSQQEAENPVLTIEGGQIQGVRAENPDVFVYPLPDDGKHPDITNRLKGAFHSSDLWYVFKSLKRCWRPWTQGDWDLSGITGITTWNQLY